MNFPVTSPEQLGAVLRGFRRQRGLSQTQLAARMGITQKAISLLETHPGRMGVARFFAVLAALEVHCLLADGPSRPKRAAEW